jgi:hypothetical protein
MTQEVIEVATRYFIDDGVVTRIEHTTGGDTFAVTPEDIAQAASIQAEESLRRQVEERTDLSEQEKVSALLPERIAEYREEVMQTIRAQYSPENMMDRIESFTNLLRLASEMREPIGEEETTPP